MSTSPLHTFSSEARQCAAVILEGATFIRGELDNVSLSAELRDRTLRLCQSLLGTQHDIANELTELDRGIDSGMPWAAETEYVERILRWLREEMTRLHGLVSDLDGACREQPDYELAYVLVAESATRMLNACDRVVTAARSVDVRSL